MAIGGCVLIAKKYFGQATLIHFQDTAGSVRMNMPPCQHDECWKPWYEALFRSHPTEIIITNPYLKFMTFDCLIGQDTK